MVVSNDTFAYRPDFGAHAIVETRSADIIELGGSSSATNNADLVALLNDAQSGLLGSHDTIVHSADQDSVHMMRVQTTEPHAGFFILH